MRGLINTVTGHCITEADAQDRIRKTIERNGRFLLSSPVMPSFGEIQEYAGLPMRFVRLVTREEFEKDDDATKDIWGDIGEEDREGLYHFEVEVAD